MYSINVLGKCLCLWLTLFCYHKTLLNCYYYIGIRNGNLHSWAVVTHIWLQNKFFEVRAVFHEKFVWRIIKKCCLSILSTFNTCPIWEYWSIAVFNSKYHMRGAEENAQYLHFLVSVILLGYKSLLVLFWIRVERLGYIMGPVWIKYLTILIPMQRIITVADLIMLLGGLRKDFGTLG